MTASTKPMALYPWPRFFARNLDYVIVAGILGIILGVVAPEHPLLEGGYLLGWIGALLWIPLEALCLAVMATTPGKALLGLSVHSDKGTNLSSTQALSRSVSAWLTGCAALLPLVSLITANRQYNLVRQGQPASWDREGGYRVEREPLSVGRKLLLAFVILLILFLMALGSASPE